MSILLICHTFYELLIKKKKLLIYQVSGKNTLVIQDHNTPLRELILFNK